MKVNLAICTNRGLYPDAVQCMLRACLTKYDFQLTVSFSVESLIDRSRSIVATQFLDSDNDILLFIDDDILYNPADISLLIADCMEKQSIVAAPYLLKKPGNVLAIKPLDMGQSFQVGASGGLQEVKYMSTGFMAIPRAVLAAVASTMQRANLGRDMEMYPIFQPVVHKGDYLSEDWAFCQRAADLGFSIWMDSRIRLGHIGPHIFV